MNKAKLKFECSCVGCRGYATRPAEIWHESQIAAKTNGYFFSRDTMKFWRSRIVDFKPIVNPHADINGLGVIVSSAYPDSPRHYEIVTICQWGQVNRSHAFGNIGLEKFDSLRHARKAFENISYPIECECHGCQLDRDGQTISERRGY